MTRPTSPIRFHRQPGGEYRFETSEGETYEAVRLDDGRWALNAVSWYPVADSSYHERRERLPETYLSRAEAAAAAWWMRRSEEDFWNHVAGVAGTAQ